MPPTLRRLTSIIYVRRARKVLERYGLRGRADVPAVVLIVVGH